VSDPHLPHDAEKAQKDVNAILDRIGAICLEIKPEPLVVLNAGVQLLADILRTLHPDQDMRDEVFTAILASLYANTNPDNIETDAGDRADRLSCLIMSLMRVYQAKTHEGLAAMMDCTLNAIHQFAFENGKTVEGAAEAITDKMMEMARQRDEMDTAADSTEGMTKQ